MMGQADDPKIWLVAETLVARHNEEALQIAYDEARARAARGDDQSYDDQSYKVWLEVAHAAGILLG